MFARTTLAAGLALALVARADVTPTSPDSTTVVNVGGDIVAMWDADTTGSWTDMEIQLMTGDNLDMIALETLATGIDGTSTMTYTAVAPDVSPNSKIYFLQFSNGGNTTDLLWTTRFTIAAADGSSTDPTNSTVYSGETVEWGTGVLVSNDTSSDNSTAATTDADSFITASVTASSTAPQSTAADGLTVYSTSTSDASSAGTSASAATSASSASPAASSSSSTSGAVKLVPAGVLMAVAAGASLLL
ncbi:hypothetical protein Q5752_002716 [Cryptotrichosporon argae]